MAQVSLLSKFRLILWKNYIIRKRHWLLTLLEIVVPFILFFLISFGRTQIDMIGREYIKEPTYHEPLDFKCHVCPVLYYTPNTGEVEKLMQKVNEMYKVGGMKGFATESDLEIAYSKDDLKRVLGIIFPPNYTESLPAQFEYTVRTYDDSVTYQTRFHFRNIMAYGSTGGSFTYRFGFIQLQKILNDAYLQSICKKEVLDKQPAVSLQEITYPPYTKDAGASSFFGYILPLLTVMSFIMLCPSILKRIVEEKSTGIKELMKMMGLKSWMLWSSWFINALVLNLVSVTIIVLLTVLPFPGGDYPVLEYCDPTILWVFLMLYCAAAISFLFFISTLFRKPTLAMSVGIVLWITSYTAPMTLFNNPEDEVALGLKVFLSLLPNLCVAMGFQAITLREIKEEGSNWGNHWMTSNKRYTEEMTLGLSMLMFVVDVLFYMTLTWYVDNVKPGEYGLAKKWYFPFTKSYWTKENIDESYQTEDSNKNNKKVEPPPKKAKAGISIQNLKKVFGGKAAVNGLTLDIYQDQITALLGHNGAGKTTTMSILTGMFSQTSGKVMIQGLNIQTQLDRVRESLGLCPQHNLLFTDLNVIEHLLFFGMLKGKTREQAEVDALDLMKRMNISEKARKMAKTLSGGMKRKLSLGIALIGDSKVLMLDEPTSGMDPEARREIWDLLLSLRGSRTILITTHFMEEADVLGDRIAIMDHGQLQCYGSSIFLKRLYGTGYQMSFMLERNAHVNEITRKIQQVVPEATVKSQAGNALNYNLPSDDSSKFPQLFNEVEENKDSLGILSIGVSITTLEEVFLRVGELVSESKKNGHASNGVESSFNVGEYGKWRNLEGMVLFWYQEVALAIKRLVYSRRKPFFIFCSLLLPILIAILTVVLGQTFSSLLDAQPKLKLQLKIYDESDVYYSSELSLQKYAKEFEQQVKTQKHKARSVPNVHEKHIEIGKDDIDYYKFKILIAAEFNNSVANGMFSNTAVHGAPIVLNMVYNSLVKDCGPDRTITISHFPFTPKDTTNLDRGMDISASIQIVSLWMFMFPIGVLFLLGSFIVFPLNERVTGVKQLQSMTGVSYFGYWIVCYIWDVLVYMFCAALIILFIYICDTENMFSGSREIGTIYLILFLYGLCGIIAAYLFVFKQSSASAFATFVATSMILGIIIVVAVIGCKMVKDDIYKTLGEVLKYIFFFMPHFTMTYASVHFAWKALINHKWNKLKPLEQSIQCAAEWNPCCDNDKDVCDQYQSYFNDDDYNITAPVVFLVVDIFFCAALLFLMEYGVMNRIRMMLQKKYLLKNSQEEISHDVKGEQDMVERDNSSYMFKAKRLKKQFGRDFLAVKGVSFGVSPGECFGLLGINGAGKTTTFRMLTGDEIPTEGSASLDNISLDGRRVEYLKRLGYCPQFDALNMTLTGKELLELFARLRGIPKDRVNGEVQKWLTKLGLNEYKNIPCGKYSGGNKRKLNTAISLIGDPALVMLDEPTSGVDPIARRNLWEVLADVQKAGQSIILTSHSMEECEALCNRLAIMVAGQLKCIGSSQFLKQQHGQGFTIMVKLQNASEALGSGGERRRSSVAVDHRKLRPQISMDAEHDVQIVKRVIEERFRCTLKDEHQGLLHYHVTDSGVRWSQLFSFMEDIKKKYGRIVEDYTVSETTLEQVFLSFAKQEMEEKARRAATASSKNKGGFLRKFRK